MANRLTWKARLVTVPMSLMKLIICKQRWGCSVWWSYLQFDDAHSDSHPLNIETLPGKRKGSSLLKMTRTIAIVHALLYKILGHCMKIFTQPNTMIMKGPLKREWRRDCLWTSTPWQPVIVCQMFSPILDISYSHFEFWLNTNRHWKSPWLTTVDHRDQPKQHPGSPLKLLKTWHRKWQ